MFDGVKNRGQVFTPARLVKSMTTLIQNKGVVLEPSCGEGAFLKELKHNYIGIEVQRGLCSYKHININFFDYAPNQRIDTIIGNPPYVRHNDIEPQTQSKLNYSLFDRRTNLYLFFVDRCIDILNNGGELIFITPRDFIKQTAAIKLNEKLYKEGAFTYFKELGDIKAFKGYSPNCVIWRWEKGNRDNKVITCKNGQLVFSKDKSETKLGDYCDIKVGAVSGADHIFKSNNPSAINFVCSFTHSTGETRSMIYNKYVKELECHKKELLNRGIKKFDESNWWEWGRKYTYREGARIYVNCKTRKPNPFFISNNSVYDGSVLAIFPHNTLGIKKLCNKLNTTNWNEYGFMCGDRHIFSQRSLTNLPFEL